MYIQIKKYEKIKNCTAGEVGAIATLHRRWGRKAMHDYDFIQIYVILQRSWGLCQTFQKFSWFKDQALYF